MTSTERVFGKQAWLAALDGTALGRAVNDEITGRDAAAVPVCKAGPTSRSSVPPPVRRHPPPRDQARRTIGPAAAGSATSSVCWRARACDCPGCGVAFASSGSSVLTLEPLAEALRSGAHGIRPVDPALVARPGLQLRLAVTALRAGVLRYVTEDGTIVEADAVHPSAG